MPVDPSFETTKINTHSFTKPTLIDPLRKDQEDNGNKGPSSANIGSTRFVLLFSLGVRGSGVPGC